MVRNRKVISVLLLAAAAQSQTRSLAVIQDEERIRGAVVFITNKGKTESAWGAGIVVGNGVKTLPDGSKATVDYIVTGNHVVANLGGAPIGVRYYKDSAEYDAHIERSGPPEQDKDDIAVISVNTKQFAAKHRGGFPSGSCVALVDYDVYMVGHPNKRLWEVSGKPAAVTAVPQDFVQFQSPVIASGNSGGALIANNLRCLVGMVIHADPPQATAISTEAIASKLEKWDIPHEFIGRAVKSDLLGLK